MKIGLAYALPGEIQSILHSANPKLLETVSGVAIYEIEPDLLAYVGGVGKVNAAMSTQLFIDRCHPDWIINAGAAGSFQDLPIGSTVLAKDFVQHDVDTTAMGDPIGLVSTVDRVDFPTSETDRLSALLTAQGVEHHVGRVATGEVFMIGGQRANWVSQTFQPMLCEMEGGAIAQVCLRNNVRFAALKTVSDRLCQENNTEEYFNYGEAMKKLNEIVLPFAKALRDE